MTSERSFGSEEGCSSSVICPGLSDLDDAVLVNIFGRLDPLPHLFNVCAVCKRFHRLGGDGRLSLRVTGVERDVQGAFGHRQLFHKTVHEAVVVSRPGDTIVLEPGTAHTIKNVIVNWPLRLLGGGHAAEDTALFCLLGADSAFNFRASGMLSNLSVRSEQSACVTHHCGRLTVQSCLLQSTPAPGLEHLYTPLVTMASSPPSRGSRAHQTASEGPDRAAGKAQAFAGGCLSVKETKIRGGEGMVAVQAQGTGKVAGVRVINLSSDTLFWFEVDSAQPSDWLGPNYRVAGNHNETAALAVSAEGAELPEGCDARKLVDFELKAKAWARFGAANKRNVRARVNSLGQDLR